MPGVCHSAHFLSTQCAPITSDVLVGKVCFFHLVLIYWSNKNGSRKMAHKKGRRGDSYLCLRSLYLLAVANVELASAVWGWVCGLRYVCSPGGGHID